jgi:serpin B
MSRTGSYLVHDSPTMRAIRLPYGQEGRFGMVILLPGAGQSLADLAGSLNSRTWYALLAKMQPRSVGLSLPRFTVEDEWNLVRPLKALGMASAFSDPAGFREMVDGPTVIGDAVHKVFMEVNEEGTEAAAVTAVMMSRSMPAPFVVDRPFVLAIHDEETGAILFLGQVTDPR